MKPIKLIGLILISQLTTPSLVAENSQTWPRFRGFGGNGTSKQNFPARLSETNRKWTTDLGGAGSSSPVIWGEHLFITTQTADADSVSLVCLNSKTGKKNWSRELKSGKYHTHRFNNAAAATPAVDGNVVIVSWYDATQKVAMLSAFEHDGEPKWDFQIGPWKGSHGVNLHPAIHDDRVLIAHLHQDGGYVGAISTDTGKEIWKTPYPGDKATYVTPLIRKITRGDSTGHEVIVASQSIGVVGLDFADGKQLWSLPGTMDQRTIVSPIDVLQGSGGKDCLIAMGCKNGTYFTVRPPWEVDGKLSEAEIVWRMEGKTPYVPTPVSDGQIVFALEDGGTLSAMKAGSGEALWKKNLRANFYASPLLLGGKLYALSREGEMIVGEVNEKGFQEIARTSLEPGDEVEWVDATPAVAHGNLYVRVGARLDCYSAAK